MNVLIRNQINSFKDEPALYIIFSFMIISLLCGLSFVGLLVYSSATKSDVVLKHVYNDYGIVKSVTGCERSKYRMHCNVLTTKYKFTRLDVTQYPGDDMLYDGDKIGVWKYHYEDRTETKLGRNGYVRSYGVCHWWMPCYPD
ncbi:hypothetical protein [Vibrio phage phiKT1024]|nr:hypothetical protein [Vibrio phage phiKT1024]